MSIGRLTATFCPVLGAPSYDGGGGEVVGWQQCSPWSALLGWLPLLVDRNMRGCLPYGTNPEPWPGFWWSTENAEISHLNSPWYWGEAFENAALVALAHTLRDVRQVYPMATPDQIHDVLIEYGVI
ncbi:hypothetical protein [Nodosilinea sp. E11]|uniref:hypothetical protein n=1 Tax=Nodosilinea sp. E11 TaxID=3037479 RepID=UPI002935221B|nr:hypothetical protein [Nodosilinea sp. E11]WOD37385.1 hypothetical protein RRF56_02585 [Nodosilinea sp. E11]WOD37947.1 hypothetical protein RRF56_17175 [Nodosilinea sp. E11]